MLTMAVKRRGPKAVPHRDRQQMRALPYRAAPHQGPPTRPQASLIPQPGGRVAT